MKKVITCTAPLNHINNQYLHLLSLIFFLRVGLGNVLFDFLRSPEIVFLSMPLLNTTISEIQI